MNTVVIPEYILIIASSARMLAQAAKRANLRSLVIDLFADLDTISSAEDYYKVSSLAVECLAPVVDEFINRYAIKYMVYGSGFECYPDSLSYLSCHLTILGNTPDTFVRIQDKRVFFAALDQLSISYPATCFSEPVPDECWLVKPLSGQGGVGIRYYATNSCSQTAVYWQKYQQGISSSVLFLANGYQTQVIGFNTQWTTALSETQGFIFSGIMNYVEISDTQKNLIISWLQKLVLFFGLKGLNSLDFILAGESLYVLEINPRPSASMQLYDADLLLCHIKASQGEWVDLSVNQEGFTGYQVVYAPQDVTIPDDFKWPDGCMDLPGCGVTCRTGQPVCSIITRQKHAPSLMDELLIKQFNLLKGF